MKKIYESVLSWLNQPSESTLALRAELRTIKLTQKREDERLLKMAMAVRLAEGMIAYNGVSKTTIDDATMLADEFYEKQMPESREIQFDALVAICTELNQIRSSAAFCKGSVWDRLNILLCEIKASNI
jgi:hypothetical protein